MIWVSLILLLLCSGVISGSETALFSLRRDALAAMERSSHWLSRLTCRLMRNPRDLLVTMLLSNTTVNLTFFSVSLLALDEWSAASPTLAAVGSVAVLLAIILFGEILPKALALAGAGVFAPYAGAFIAALRVPLWPATWFLGRVFVEPITRLLAPPRHQEEAVSIEELHQLVEQSTRAGVIDSLESEMLRAVVELREATVREVMTHRVDVRYVRLHDGLSTVRRMFRETRRRFMPVCGRDLDDIVGLVRGRDVFLNEATTLVRLAQPPTFIPEQATLTQLLRHFREHSVQIAIVVDEYGGTAGLISQHDVLEHMVGALPEEGDESLPDILRIDESTYQVPGTLSIRDWPDRFRVGSTEGIDTVGGLILSHLGKIPRVGDTVTVQNVELRVDDVRNRRIRQVTIRRRADVSAGGNP